jgi:hypothetical protein
MHRNGWTLRYAGKTFRFNCVRMTADGVHALTDGDLGANYWAVQTGKVLRRFPGPRFGFSTLALSPDERVVATSGSDGLTFWGFDWERAFDGSTAPARSRSGTHWIQRERFG